MAQQPPAADDRLAQKNADVPRPENPADDPHYTPGDTRGRWWVPVLDVTYSPGGRNPLTYTVTLTLGLGPVDTADVDEYDYTFAVRLDADGTLDNRYDHVVYDIMSYYGFTRWQDLAWLAGAPLPVVGHERLPISRFDRRALREAE